MFILVSSREEWIDAIQKVKEQVKKNDDSVAQPQQDETSQKLVCTKLQYFTTAVYFTIFAKEE